jgi:hypothetical protein
MLYVGTDGKLYAGVYDNSNKVANSTAIVTDDIWRFGLMTFNGNTLNLYLDDTLVGTQLLTAAIAYTGYWRLGSYRLAFWQQASDGYFTGCVGSATYWDFVLNASQRTEAFNKYYNLYKNVATSTPSPSPSESPSPTPSGTPSPTPSNSPSPTPSPSPSNSLSPTPSPSPSNSPSPTPSPSPSGSPSPTPSFSPSPTPSFSPSPTPSNSPSPTPSFSPSPTPSPTFSGTPSPTPSFSPSPTPSPTPSPSFTNSPTPSPSNSATPTPTPTPTSLFRAAAIDLDPASYSGTGTNLPDISGNSNNGILLGSPLPPYVNYPASFTFNGSGQSVATSNQAASLSDFTFGVWFKTGVAGGQKIAGFENNQLGAGSTSYDKSIYVGTDGKLYGAIYDSSIPGMITVSTTFTVNDNTWRYAVLRYNGGTLSLYVDGVQIGTSLITSSTPYNGYWRLGGYKNSASPNGTDGFFTGDIGSATGWNMALNSFEINTAYTRYYSLYKLLSTGTPSPTPSHSATPTPSSSPTPSPTPSPTGGKGNTLKVSVGPNTPLQGRAIDTEGYLDTSTNENYPYSSEQRTANYLSLIPNIIDLEKFKTYPQVGDKNVITWNLQNIKDVLPISRNTIVPGTCIGTCEWVWNQTNAFAVSQRSLLWILISNSCSGGCICDYPNFDGIAIGEITNTNCK